MNKYKLLSPQILINILIVTLTFSLEIKHTIASGIGDICGDSIKTKIVPPPGEFVYVCSKQNPNIPPNVPDASEIVDGLKDMLNGIPCGDKCNEKDKCENHCMCVVDYGTKKVDINIQADPKKNCFPANSPIPPKFGDIPPPSSPPPNCVNPKIYPFICVYEGQWKISCDCRCQTLNKEEKRGNRKKICTTCGCDENLVKLSNFTAKPTNKGISLNWNTEAESDSQGFKMWRAIPKLDSYCGCSGNIDDYTQIQVLDKEGKPVLIPAKGTETSGYDYSYLDEGAKPGIAYCYALEDVDSKGESKFYFEYVAFTQDNLEESK